MQTVPLEDAEPHLTAEDDWDSWEDRQTLYTHLRALDDRSREALALRYWGGLSYAEVARAMDITEKNASVLLTRAVAKLRKRFDVVNA